MTSSARHLMATLAKLQSNPSLAVPTAQPGYGTSACGVGATIVPDISAVTAVPVGVEAVTASDIADAAAIAGGDLTPSTQPRALQQAGVSVSGSGAISASTGSAVASSGKAKVQSKSARRPSLGPKGEREHFRLLADLAAPIAAADGAIKVEDIDVDGTGTMGTSSSGSGGGQHGGAGDGSSAGAEGRAEKGDAQEELTLSHPFSFELELADHASAQPEVGLKALQQEERLQELRGLQQQQLQQHGVQAAPDAVDWIGANSLAAAAAPGKGGDPVIMGDGTDAASSGPKRARTHVCPVPGCGKTMSGCSSPLCPGVPCWHLRRHLRTVHDGIKDYRCSICGMLFGQKGNALKHVELHHGNNGTVVGPNFNGPFVLTPLEVKAAQAEKRAAERRERELEKAARDAQKRREKEERERAAVRELERLDREREGGGSGSSGGSPDEQKSGKVVSRKRKRDTSGSKANNASQNKSKQKRKGRSQDSAPSASARRTKTGERLRAQQAAAVPSGNSSAAKRSACSAATRSTRGAATNDVPRRQSQRPLDRAAARGREARRHRRRAGARLTAHLAERAAVESAVAAAKATATRTAVTKGTTDAIVKNGKPAKAGSGGSSKDEIVAVNTRVEYLFGDVFYAGSIRGTYRKQRDWYRVLFDDGAHLTIHLDPKTQGKIWRFRDATADVAQAAVAQVRAAAAADTVKCTESGESGGGTEAKAKGKVRGTRRGRLLGRRRATSEVDTSAASSAKSTPMSSRAPSPSPISDAGASLGSSSNADEHSKEGSGDGLVTEYLVQLDDKPLGEGRSLWLDEIALKEDFPSLSEEVTSRGW
eukprot:g549.t1